MLNVLDLGVKNDGSADISEIVNTHTAKGTLYFPAGIYKVAKPLWLKQPICGDGYARVPVHHDPLSFPAMGPIQRCRLSA